MTHGTNRLSVTDRLKHGNALNLVFSSVPTSQNSQSFSATKTDSSVSIVTDLDFDGLVSNLCKDIYDLCTDRIRGPASGTSIPEHRSQSVKLASISWSD